MKILAIIVITNIFSTNVDNVPVDNIGQCQIIKDIYEISYEKSILTDASVSCFPMDDETISTYKENGSNLKELFRLGKINVKD